MAFDDGNLRPVSLTSGIAGFDDGALKPVSEPEKNSALRRAVGDTMVTLGQGIVDVPEIAIGLADIPTFGAAGKFVENTGIRTAEAKKVIESWYSDDQKKANERVENADGFVGTGQAMLDNPSTILQTAVRSVPAMLGGGAVARGLIGSGAKLSPLAAGAIGEGAVSAGSMAESVRQQTDDGLLTPKQAAASIAAGVGTGAIGFGGATVAKKLGIGEVDTLLAGGSRPDGKGVVRSAAEGAVVEGALQEMPQSMQEQAFQNVATDRPVTEGVGASAAAGLLAGGVIGGVAGPLGREKPAAEDGTQDPGVQPEDQPTPAAPAGGALSRAAALLPAPAEPLALPAPEQVTYVDGNGVAQNIGPVRNVDGEMRPEPQARVPAMAPVDVAGGRGMFAQAPEGTRVDTIPAEEQRRIDRQQVEAIEQERADRLAAARVDEANRAAAEIIQLRREQNQPDPEFTLPRGLELADKDNHGRWLNETYRGSVQALIAQLEKGGGVAYVRDKHDRIVGRTPSSNPMWWQNMDTSVKPGSVEEGRRIVNKALEGKSLGPKQARFVAAMMDIVDDIRLPPQQAEQNRAILQELEWAASGEAARNQADVEKGGRLYDVDAQDDAELYAYLDGKVEPFRLSDLMPDEVEQIRVELIMLDDTSEQTAAAGDNNDTEESFNGTNQRAGETGGEVPAREGIQSNGQGLQEDRGTVPSGRQPDSFELETQTEEQLAAQAEAQRQREKADAEAGRQEEQRVDADRQRDAFNLTGSDRAADVGAAAGQGDLLTSSTPAQPAPTEKAQAQSSAGVTIRSGDKFTSNPNNPVKGKFAAFHGEQMLSPAWRDTREEAQADGASVAADTEATPRPAAKPKKASKGRSKQSELYADMADYFAPGNVVKSYDGHDRVVSYTPPDSEGRWSVTVRAVRKDGDSWVDVDGQANRTHMTPPDARNLKSGPVGTVPAQSATANVTQQLSEMNQDDLAALIDEVAAETAAPETSKPKAKRSKKAVTAAGKPRVRKTATKAERTDISSEQDVSRTAGEIAKSLGVNMSSAGMNALEGLTKLFGGPGRLNSGLSFDEETYAKAKPHFAAALADIQAAGKDLRDFIRALVGQFGDGVKPYILRFAQDIREEQAGERTDQRLEPDSAEDAEQGTGGDPVQEEPAGGGRGAGQLGDQAGGQGGPDAAAGVSGRGAAASGERGDSPVDGSEPGLEGSNAGAADGSRGRPSSTGGLFAERDTDAAAGRVVESAVSAPAKANIKASNSPGTVAEIKAQMPFLTDGQVDDIVFAERRLMKPEGYGVLFTNGTGTGKTFTGLGVVARSVARGKDNILIITPKQTINDAWVKAGEQFFGVKITPLESTSDNGGSGVVVATYANVGDNPSLAQREWDMVISDEAHYLSSAEDGSETKALAVLRALTRRRGTSRALVNLREHELVAEMKELRASAKARREGDNQQGWYKAAEEEEAADAIQERLSALYDQEEQKAKQLKPEDKPRGVFLSATPFAYEKNVQWAQEFLFDWGVDEGSGGGYNSGGRYEQFMMQHFGYRMRYNKLTAPDANVDRGLMQRAFNAWLKKEGALSSRALDSKFDYDRRFVTVDSSIGRRVDEALKWLWDQSSSSSNNDDDMRYAFQQLNDRISKESFNYHARMYFLEAIKGKEAVPYIRAHLDAGRKVLVMHDFKKGGVANPFRLSPGDDAERKAYRQFADTFPDLISAFDYLPSPITQLTRAFPDALVYNGSVTAKNRIELQNRFNSDDDDAPRVIIAQGDAMREGVSIHDTSGKFMRVLVHLGMPVKPTAAIQQEGRIYRTGQASDALFRYFTIGTSWERSAFASTIAGRAGTAENLAMGEQARGLKQAFITAYENAGSYEPGYEGEGKGGKAADIEAATALTPWDSAKSFYFGTKKQGKGRSARGREGQDYFATPEPVGLKMVEWADIRGGESVLEPSVGHGAIGRWFPENSRVRAIEQSADLASRAALHVNGDIVHGRFEDHNIVNKYDAIVMNPPYGLGGAVAIPHLIKATEHLREGGRVVALIPTGPAADKRFEKWFYGQDGSGKSLAPNLHLVGDVRMPRVTFERAGTEVPTRIVVIEKAGKETADKVADTRVIDLANADSIEALFDRLENIEMAPRAKPVEAEAEQTAPTKSIEPKPSYAEKAAAETDKYVTDAPVIEHVTGKGKVLRGVIVRDLSVSEVKDKFYKYAFKKDGGVFLREEFIERPDSPMMQLRGATRVRRFIDRGTVEQVAIRKMGKSTVARQFRFVSFSELPPEILDAVAAQGMKPEEVRAIHWRGKTYLVDDRFRSEKDAAQAMFHEHYAHYGLRAKYGAELRFALGKMLRGVGGLDGVKQLAASQGIDLELYEAGMKKDRRISAEQRSLVMMEELLAHMAESTGSLKSVLQEFVGLVRNWLRSVNYPGMAELGVTDLAYELKMARRASVEAGRNDGGNAPQFSLSAASTNQTDATDGVRFSLAADDAVTEEALRKLGLLPEAAKSLAERVKEMTREEMRSLLDAWGKRSEEGLFDGLNGIKKAEEAVGVTDPNKQGYVSARLATGVADVMHAVMHYGAPEWQDGIIGARADTKGLLDILADLGAENLQDWLGWVGGQRAKMLKDQGRENNLSDAEIAELIGLGKGKEQLFESVYQEYAKINEAVLDVAQGAGLLEQDAREKWVTDYYVPFYRVDDEGLFFAPRGKKGLSHQSAGIKALKGGALPTNDLLENILTNWTRRIDASLKNKALLEVVDNLKGSDFLTDESIRYTQAIVPRAELAKRIRKDRKTLAAVSNMLGMPEGSTAIKVASELMKPENKGFEKLWAATAPSDPDIIRVQRGGRNEYYKVNDESLLRGLKHMAGSTFNDPVTRIGRAFKRLLTTGVTAAPDFILRNFIRDAAHAWVINKDGYKFGIDSLKGLRQAFAQDSDYRDLMFAGSSFQGGYVHGNDPEAAAHIVRRALDKKGLTKGQRESYMQSLVTSPAQMAGLLKQGWEKYREGADRVENSQRLATYKAALAAGKSRRQAAYEAKDLMDYSLRGNFAAAQWFTDVVPFLNARMQGLYKLGRAMKGDRSAIAKEVALKGAYLAAFSLLLAAMNGDDDRYKELPEWDKDMNWHLWLGDQHFRIPKPFELGLIFGTIPERMLLAATGEQTGGQLTKAVARGVFETLAFNPVPQFYQPIREVQANRDFFRDRPIENMADEGKLPEARYDDRTSAIGKALGQLTGPALGISPKQLDHLVQGYTGTLGGYVLSLSSLVADLGNPGERPDSSASRWPVLKVLYGGSDPRSTQYHTDFYDMLSEADQIYRTVRSYREEGRMEEAAALMADQSDKLKHRRALGMARQQFGAIRKRMGEIYDDPRMSGAEKRRQLNALQLQSNEIAARMVRLAGADF